jgi:Homeodomain-like domain-containing protein
MTLERETRVASFFAAFDEGLARLVRVSRGERLIAAARARSALAELAREFGEDSRLAWLIRSARDRPRGAPFACKFSDAQIESAMSVANQRVAAAAAALGCTRSAVYRWRDRKSRAIASDKLQPVVPLVSDRRR